MCLGILNKAGKEQIFWLILVPFLTFVLLIICGIPLKKTGAQAPFAGSRPWLLISGIFQAAKCAFQIHFCQAGAEFPFAGCREAGGEALA